MGLPGRRFPRNPGLRAVRSPETAPALLPQGDRKNLYGPENPQGARYGAQGRKKQGRGAILWRRGGESGLSDQAGESMNQPDLPHSPLR